MNSGSAQLDSLLTRYTNKKEREILEQYAGGPVGLWEANQLAGGGGVPLPPPIGTKLVGQC